MTQEETEDNIRLVDRLKEHAIAVAQAQIVLDLAKLEYDNSLRIVSELGIWEAGIGA